jgi:hypothetical protein
MRALAFMRGSGQSAPVRSFVLLAVVALTSCGDAATSNLTSEPASASAISPSTSAVSETGVDGPVMRYPQRASAAEELAAPVRGVLQLEGSCLYVFIDEAGERYPMVWPAGTQWDDASESVISPIGERMPIGSHVFGGGGYFYVPDVERIAGPVASALASRCVDNTYGEIAIVNNVDSAIGPAQS